MDSPVRERERESHESHICSTLTSLYNRLEISCMQGYTMLHVHVKQCPTTLSNMVVDTIFVKYSKLMRHDKYTRVINGN